MPSYNVEINRYKASGNTYDQLLPKPSKHKSSHAKGGADALTPSDIGAPTIEQFNELKNSVSEGKALVARAVTDKGVQTAPTATFQTIANNIRNISVGGKYGCDVANEVTLESADFQTSAQLNSYVFDLGVEIKDVKRVQIWGLAEDGYQDNQTRKGIYYGTKRLFASNTGEIKWTAGRSFTYSGNQIILPDVDAVVTVSGTKVTYQYKSKGKEYFRNGKISLAVTYPVE